MKTLKQMTNLELLKLYKEYDDLIHGANPCFGTKDVIYLDQIEREMDAREEHRGKD
jgi:hypothetical protein